MELEEDSLVLGRVDKIEHMNVFVKLTGGKIGTIVNSEIAPGRIKNLREYVAPNKIIVCKVLRNSNNHFDLSLRRVSAKEKQEVLTKYQQEKDFEKGLDAILKDKSAEVLGKIKEDFPELMTFLEKAQQDEGILKKYIPSAFHEQIKKITEKKKREVEVKKIIKLKCLDSDGIKRIKEIFQNEDNEVKITYVSAGNYLATVKAEDYKKANQKMQELTDTIEKKSKKCTCEFSTEDRKSK